MPVYPGALPEADFWDLNVRQSTKSRFERSRWAADAARVLTAGDDLAL